MSLTFALAGCHGGPSANPSAEATASHPAPAHSVGGATTTEQPAGSTAKRPAAPQGWSKLSPELKVMATQVQAASDGTAAKALSNSRIHVNTKKQIQVYVYVNNVDAATESRLAKAGAVVERGVTAMKVYQVWASPSALQHISKLPDVVRITPPAYGFPK